VVKQEAPSKLDMRCHSERSLHLQHDVSASLSLLGVICKVFMGGKQIGFGMDDWNLVFSRYAYRSNLLCRGDD
jgi:hypothetical protein